MAQSTAPKWKYTEAMRANAGAADDNTLRVVAGGVGEVTITHYTLTPDQDETLADIPGVASRVVITIQNTGTSILLISEGENTNAGTRGLYLRACSVAGDGTGGIYETKSSHAIWIWAVNPLTAAALAEEQSA